MIGMLAAEPYSACIRILEMLIVSHLVKFLVYLIHCIVRLVTGP